MTDKESFQYNTNNRPEKKESILRNILKVKEDINEVDDEIAITDTIEGGSSCETVILDEEFHGTRNQEKPSELQQGNFSDDSLDDNINAARISRREKMDNVNHQTNQLLESVISSNLKVGREKSFRKPSMIPKLSRNKLLDNTKTNLLEQKQDFRSNRFSDQRKITSFKTNGRNNNAPLCTGMSNFQADVQPVTLSCLQQKLKATTSIIKHKMEFRSTKETNSNRNKPKSIQSISSAGLAEQEKPTSANTLGALYKSITQIRETASELSKSDSFKNQKGHIEKLFKYISEIQSIADKLTDIERKPHFLG